MYTAIIIDDESKPREILGYKLTEIFSQLQIVGMAASAQEGYEKCMETKPDIVFLDVQMPAENGFDFVHKFRKLEFEIIFVTAHAEYLLDAFRISAVGYILKPVINEDLKFAVNNAIERIKWKYAAERYQVLLDNLKSQNRIHQKLVIPSHDRYEFVYGAEIIYCEGDEKYTNIYTTDHRKLLSIHLLFQICQNDEFFKFDIF